MFVQSMEHGTSFSFATYLIITDGRKWLIKQIGLMIDIVNLFRIEIELNYM